MHLSRCHLTALKIRSDRCDLQCHKMHECFPDAEVLVRRIPNLCAFVPLCEKKLLCRTATGQAACCGQKDSHTEAQRHEGKGRNADEDRIASTVIPNLCASVPLCEKKLLSRTATGQADCFGKKGFSHGGTEARRKGKTGSWYALGAELWSQCLSFFGKLCALCRNFQGGSLATKGYKDYKSRFASLGAGLTSTQVSVTSVCSSQIFCLDWFRQEE